MGGREGFTLLEIIAVLIIIAVLSASVVPRLFTGATEAYAAADILRSHLRFAQSRSMNSNTVFGIAADGAQYWLFSSADTATPLQLPGEEGSTVTCNDLGITSVTGFTSVSFDTWGRAYSSADASGAATDIHIIVAGDGAVVTISITGETGFIP
jgi:prepilin-type N-terminal cleavage/methylation domain-containing protein